MVIANPIYDVVFKFLMEDERIAKFFIGTLLDEIIEDVKFSPQEYAFMSQLDNPDAKIREDAKAQLVERISISVFRLDFIATIRTQTGELKKVLVEIQKAKNAVDLMRFRNYLGEQYKKEDEVEGKKISLPIVTIYLLGFKLPEIESAVVKVDRKYIDLLTHKVIEKKSDFIEKLTHDCYVVQLGRIEAKVQTKLEKLLSVFEQKHFVDNNNTIKEYKLAIDDEDVNRMIDKLHYAGTEPLEKRKIEDEKEAYRVLDWATQAKSEELKREIEDNKRIIEESKKEIEDNKKEIEDNKKEIQESKKEVEESKKVITENAKALEEKDKLIEELLNKLNKK